MAFLEIIRFSSNGGILNGDSGFTASRSAFSCAFEYLKTPNLMPAVFQCLKAIVNSAFETAVLWLVCLISVLVIIRDLLKERKVFDGIEFIYFCKAKMGFLLLWVKQELSCK